MPTDNRKNTTNKKINIDVNKSLIACDIIELFLVLFIVVLFYVSIPVTSTKVIYIPNGSTSAIISYLNKSGYELNFIDKTIIRFLGYPQQGWIDLKYKHLSKGDFLYKLVTSKAALRNITLIPGETSYFFLKDIAKALNLSEEKLIDTYNKLAYKNDGNILAESYSLPLGMSEENLIYYLFSYTNKKYEEFARKIFGEYNKNKWFYYVSIASVVQKEAANVDEMPYVSSVIHNRLKRGMPLQMDGTLNYAQYSHDVVSAKRIKEDRSPYNTYLNKGVPEHPVCAVSLAAIKAAIFPAKTEYLYFVKDKKTNAHKFSASYKEHVNTVNSNIVYIRTTPKKKVEPTEKTPSSKESIFDQIKTPSKPTAIKNLWQNVK